MRPGPKKPGESAAEYSARVKAMEERWKAGIGRPKTSGTKPTGAGGGRGGMTPPPGMMYGPDDGLIPIPKKGGTPRPRGTSPAPGYGGGKPVRVMPGKTPMRVTGGMGMKSGGTVKGKK